MNRYFDQLISFENLWKSSQKAVRGKKKRREVAQFYYHLERELIEIQRELESLQYQPGDYRTFTIHDPKTREISAAPFRDRVIHHAVAQVMEPVLERFFIYHSYGCRREKGPHKAVSKAQEFCRKSSYFLQCDIRKFFYSISHPILKKLLAKKFPDEKFLAVLYRILDKKPEGTLPGRGLPIGNLTSQHFANLYLDQLDHEVKDQLGVKGYLRYMDDFCIFGNDKEEMWEILGKVWKFLHERLELELKKFQISPVTEGLSFLGMRIFPSLIRLQSRKWRRFKERFKQRQREFIAGKVDLSTLLQSTAGMMGHISHGNTYQLRRTFLKRWTIDI